MSRITRDPSHGRHTAPLTTKYTPLHAKGLIYRGGTPYTHTLTLWRASNSRSERFLSGDAKAWK